MTRFKPCRCTQEGRNKLPSIHAQGVLFSPFYPPKAPLNLATNATIQWITTHAMKRRSYTTLSSPGTATPVKKLSTTSTCSVGGATRGGLFPAQAGGLCPALGAALDKRLQPPHWAGRAWLHTEHAVDAQRAAVSGKQQLATNCPRVQEGKQRQLGGLTAKKAAVYVEKMKVPRCRQGGHATSGCFPMRPGRCKANATQLLPTQMHS